MFFSGQHKSPKEEAGPVLGGFSLKRKGRGKRVLIDMECFLPFQFVSSVSTMQATLSILGYHSKERCLPDSGA